MHHAIYTTTVDGTTTERHTDLGTQHAEGMAVEELQRHGMWTVELWEEDDGRQPYCIRTFDAFADDTDHR